MEKDNRKRVSPFSHRNYFHPITLFRPHQKEAHSARGKKRAFFPITIGTNCARHGAISDFHFSQTTTTTKKPSNIGTQTLLHSRSESFFFCSVLFCSLPFNTVFCCTKVASAHPRRVDFAPYAGEKIMFHPS